MLNRLRQIMIRQYFGDQFSMKYRIYMIFFFESYFISVLSAITNTSLKKGLAGIVLQWTYIAFCTLLLFMLPRIRLAFLKPHLLFVTFIYIPFLYFQTAGYHGTALLFAPLGLFLLGIVFSGRVRIAVIALNILNYLVCIFISHIHPHTVVPHNGPGARFIDLVVAFVLSSLGLAILTIYISRVFEDNRKSLAALSLQDELTGAYNRRFMASFLQGALDVSRKTHKPFYVLMLDIDHFKRINDTYGHGFGDRVLISCVQAAQSVLRAGDIIARYGGEEFAVILFCEQPAHARDIAERICRTISSLRFHEQVRVTVSIGLTRSRPEDTIEGLLGRADLCMYKAKQSGRNKVSAGSMSDYI